MTRPLWVDPHRQGYPPLDGEIDVDVAIVGGGFSGLGAAWALYDSGATIALLEARTVASGASGRNAGFVGAGPAMGYRESVRAIGVEGTAEIWKFTRRNQALLAGISECYGIECGYLRRGGMALAASEEEWGEMVEDFRGMDLPELSACIVERASLPRPFDRLYHGGIYHGGSGEIEPGLFLHGVAAALQSNVRIFESSRVVSLEDCTDWVLRTERGTVRARRVILATNAYTDRILPHAGITPVRGQVLATIPLHRVVVPFPMHANHGYQYWRQTAGGVLVAGGWRDLDIEAEVGVEEHLNPLIQASLESFIGAVAGEGVRVEYRWAGIMGFTPDRFPLVGLVPGRPGLAIAAGYTGHGVAMAFLCGAEAARLGTGQEADLPACFNPARYLG